MMAALQHLRHNKHEVGVLSRAWTWRYRGRLSSLPTVPTIFRDLESGAQEVRLHPADVREAYTRRMAAPPQGTRGALLRNTVIDWVDVDIAAGCLSGPVGLSGQASSKLRSSRF